MRILFLIGLFFLVSCNSELAKLSPINYTKIRIETTNAGAFNQMMIYALKSDGSHGFGRLFTSLPVIEEDAPLGLYDFYGMTFTGSGPGLISDKCSKATAYMGGNLNQVTLDFQEVTCGDSDFLGSDPDLNTTGPATVTFPTTSLEFCDSVQNITAGTDRCSDNLAEPMLKHKRGQAMSANVSLMTFERTRGRTVVGTGFSAGCMNVTPSTYLRGLSPTNVPSFLPAGNGSTTPFLVRFEIYANSASCTTDTAYVLDLAHGLAANNSNAKQIVTPGATRKIFVKMSGNEICQGDNLTAEFAGGVGSYDSPKLICNESHLYNIFPATSTTAAYSANANFSYKLLSDIDLTDNPVIGSGFTPPWASCVLPTSNFMPIGTLWNGTACSFGNSIGIQFLGNDKTIKGMKILTSQPFVGLYRQTSHAGGQHSYIQNLNISDSTFIGHSYTGSLVGHCTRTNFDNINLINVHVESTTSSYTGGIIGESFATPINNVHGTSITVIGNDYVGGLAGQTHISNFSMTDIFDSSIRGNITGLSLVGGLVGNLGAASVSTYQSIVKRSSFVGSLTANNIVGGIAGQAISSRIEHSYVRANFTAPAASNTRLGGLVGAMMISIAPLGITSGIYSSYILLGNLANPCFPNTLTCNIGTVVGFTDHSSTRFDTVAYSSLDYLQTTPYIYGMSQDDSSFMLANPAWSIMGSFPTSVWQFTNGRFPYLINEPNP